ncbi:MAG: HDOD domain-containing protein [Candidatus Accumulibacter sp.]|nr:HDOD domain-containing protein [Accumulibacter sp.]
MLRLLRGLFGGTVGDTQDDPVSSSLLPSISSISVNEGVNVAPRYNVRGTHDSAFFCREALVGRDQKIVGYEFGYPRHLHPRIVEKRARLRQYYDNLLLRHLAGLELDSFLGDRLALIEISPLSLEHPSLAVLLRRKIALLLSFPEAEIPDARMLTQVIAIISQMRANEARIGLKWQIGWKQKVIDFPLLPYVDFVQVAWPDCAGVKDIPAFFSSFRQAHARSVGSSPNAPREMFLRLIVSDLQTPNDFRQCYRLGIDLFRGEFINSRDQDRVPRSAVNRLLVLQLLNKLRQDEDTSHLEEDLKQDPVLSYRLLTYANSPLLGAASGGAHLEQGMMITHLGHAMMIIGRNKLQRWLSSLLFSVSDPSYYEWALTEQALARAALMDRLGKRASGVRPDAMFLTGLFSLLDQMTGKPMEELAAQMQLPDDIRIALVRREGVMARFLSLVEACERMEPEIIAQKAEALQLSSHTVSLAVFDALSWAHSMIQLNEE